METMFCPEGKSGATREGTDYLFEKLSVLMKTGLIRIEGDDIVSYPRSDPSNPILRSEALRRRLLDGVNQHEVPFLWEDSYHVFFAGIRCGRSTENSNLGQTGAGRRASSPEGWCLLGPMSTEGLDLLQRHKFYLSYGITRVEEKELPHFTLYEVVNAVCAVAKVLCGTELTEKELMQVNHLSYEPEETRREQVLYSMKEDDREFYRHTYQDERELLDKVREGNAEEAVRLSGIMDAQIGRLASVELDHWRNLLIVSVTLCARAAIEGGLEPHKAYRISGFYIRKGTGCRNGARVVEIRNNAIRELADNVHEVRNRKHVSGYTKQCRDYIEQHYREKISQEEVASHLGISADYLSRLFREEVGTGFSDYVNQFRVERAANLLLYSGESLSEIARYVNFPSQSYFGRMFKKYKGITPGQYRETYKPSEFISAQ